MEADYWNFLRLSPGLAFNMLIPQLFDLTGLLEDYSICSFDQDGHFVYPESLSIDRDSIVPKGPESLYLLYFKSTFFFFACHPKADSHILSTLLGPNYKERIMASDLDGLHISNQNYEPIPKSSNTLASRLRQFISHEDSGCFDSIRTRLALRNTQNEAIFYSIIDEFSNIAIS
jgi:hypothetical protein